MKILTFDDASLRLQNVKMKIGEWNRLIPIDSMYGCSDDWVNYLAPENARELFNFSEHVAGWMPDGAWIILQIDNSGSLDITQSALFKRLMFGSEEIKNFTK